MKARRRRAEADHADRMSQAWHTAVLGRVEKMPPLSDLTGIKPKIKKMTPAEFKAVFASMRETA